MRTLGKLLIIWGSLLPLIALPSTAFGTYAIIPLLNISLSNMNARIGSLEMTYDRVVVWALLLVGLGLSLCVMPAADDNPKH
jgi:hypothetical protein